MKLLILLAFVLCAHALEDSGVLEKWSEFQLKYDKNYRSPIEVQKRLNIFRENLKIIEVHNAHFEKGKVSYTKGITKFADWTPEEFMSYVNSSLLTKPTIIGETYKNRNVKIPNAVDWRDSKVVTPVKDQGDCGSCWAFSTTGSIESHYALEKGELMSLSEQDLIDCSFQQGNLGCNGGLMTQGFDYVKRNGIRREVDYPYTGEDGRCKAEHYDVFTKIKKYVNIDEGSEEDLQEAIATLGPVSVALDATLSLQLYSGGILNDPTCSSTSLNHGVLAVGYGGSKTKRYYIIKNSWGDDWGESGYFRLPLNKNNKCGIASMASYPVI